MDIVAWTSLSERPPFNIVKRKNTWTDRNVHPTEAKQGQIDEDWKVDRDTVLALLSGTRPSPDPQREAYRLLLVAACNYYHSQMPFLFEKIEDFTELLLPDDLLSGNSVLTYTREALLPENCSPEFTE